MQLNDEEEVFRCCMCENGYRLELLEIAAQFSGRFVDFEIHKQGEGMICFCHDHWEILKKIMAIPEKELIMKMHRLVRQDERDREKRENGTTEE